MSEHISALTNEIAEMVLLPGDPLRAKHIAENYLINYECVNCIRNMLAFTGLTKDGKEVTVMGSGMGLSSINIYVTELIDFYKVKKIIRLGSCGAFPEDIDPYDIIIAQSASSDYNLNRMRFNGIDYAPSADWDLLYKAYQAAEKLKIKVRIGSIFSTEAYYHSKPDYWKVLAEYGVLGVEMETAELYTLASQKKIQSLTILTVSDNLVTGKKVYPKSRENSFDDMTKIALEI